MENKGKVDSSNGNQMRWMKETELRPVGVIDY